MISLQRVCIGFYMAALRDVQESYKMCGIFCN